MDPPLGSAANPRYQKLDKPALLSLCPLFSGLSPWELKSISQLMRLVEYRKDEVIYKEGGEADRFHVVVSGRFEASTASQGKKKVLAYLRRGDYFGEMELDQGPRSASVVALERSELAVIRQSEFRKFLAENRDFAMRLILKLIARKRGLLKHVKSLALLDVSHRVARLLLEMATEENGKLIITQKLSKRDIANRVGATREMASRVFKDLVVSGYIELENEKITIAKRLPQHW